MITTLLIALPLLLSPGPGYIVSLTLAAQLGFTNIIRFLLGISIVYVITSILLGYFMMQIISLNPGILNIIQLLGGIFILYLGIRLAYFSDNTDIETIKPNILNGLIIQFLNSKYFIVVILIFSIRSDEPILITAIIITVISVFGLLIYSLIGSLVHSFLTSKGVLRIMNLSFGIMLCLVGVWLLSTLPKAIT